MVVCVFPTPPSFVSDDGALFLFIERRFTSVYINVRSLTNDNYIPTSWMSPDIGRILKIAPHNWPRCQEDDSVLSGLDIWFCREDRGWLGRASVSWCGV